MNPLIKKLAEQAELPTIDGEWDYNDREILRRENGEWRVATSSEIIAVLFECEKGREKFAELIVKECAEVASCNGHVSGFTLGDLIKEHFGVEE